MPTIGEFLNDPKNGYRIAQFQALCEDYAVRAADQKIDFHHAVDSCWNYAVGRDLTQLIGVDNCQDIMSQAFKNYYHGRK
jgi:hypothetical protein